MRWDSCCACAEDVLYGLKETARKILHPGGSDEMNLKRIVRYLNGLASAKCLTDIRQIPAVRGRVHRLCLGSSVHELQDYVRWSCTVGKCNLGGLATNTTVSELELTRSSADDQNCFSDVDEALHE